MPIPGDPGPDLNSFAGQGGLGAAGGIIGTNHLQTSVDSLTHTVSDFSKAVKQITDFAKQLPSGTFGGAGLAKLLGVAPGQSGQGSNAAGGGFPAVVNPFSRSYAQQQPGGMASPAGQYPAMGPTSAYQPGQQSQGTQQPFSQLPNGGIYAQQPQAAAFPQLGPASPYPQAASGQLPSMPPPPGGYQPGGLTYPATGFPQMQQGEGLTYPASGNYPISGTPVGQPFPTAGPTQPYAPPTYGPNATFASLPNGGQQAPTQPLPMMGGQNGGIPPGSPTGGTGGNNSSSLPSLGQSVAGIATGIAGAGASALPGQTALNTYQFLSSIGGGVGGSGYTQNQQMLAQQVGGTAGTAAFGNAARYNQWATGLTDASQAFSILGAQAGNPMLNQTSIGRNLLGGTASMSYLNPGMTGTQAAQATSSLYTPQQSLQERMLGYQNTPLIAGVGANKRTNNMAQWAAGQFQGWGLGPGHNLNANQMRADLGPNGPIYRNLAAEGLNPSQYAPQLEAYNALYQGLGTKGTQHPALTINQAQKLMSGLSSQNPSVFKQATATLQNYGINQNDLDRLKGVAGTQAATQADKSRGFTAGLDAAIKALEKFRLTLGSFENRVGLSTPLGAAEGAGAVAKTVGGGGIGMLGLLGLAGKTGLLGKGIGAIGKIFKGFSGGGGGDAATGAGAGEAGAAAEGAGGMGALGTAGLAAGGVGAGVGAGLGLSWLARRALKSANVPTSGREGMLASAANFMSNEGVLTGRGRHAGGQLFHDVGHDVGNWAGDAGSWLSGLFGGGAASVGGASVIPGSHNTNKNTAGSAPKQAVAAVHAAETQLGVPYKWGAEQPGKGFDCAGLTQWAYKMAGVKLPRTAEEQFRYLESRRVPPTQAEEGDLVFSSGTSGGLMDPSHVGLMISHSKLIQAPYTGGNVQIVNYEPHQWQHAARPGGKIGALGKLSDLAGRGAGSKNAPLHGGAAKGKGHGGGISGSTVAAFAKKYATGRNHPYVWGGDSPSGWDCSGFSAFVYEHFGFFPGHGRHGTSESQFHDPLLKSSGDQPGALVFFNTHDGQPPPSHVGVSLGGGRYAGADDQAIGTAVRSSGGNMGFRIPKHGFASGSAGAGGAGGGGGSGSNVNMAALTALLGSGGNAGGSSGGSGAGGFDLGSGDTSSEGSTSESSAFASAISGGAGAGSGYYGTPGQTAGNLASQLAAALGLSGGGGGSGGSGGGGSGGPGTGKGTVNGPTGPMMNSKAIAVGLFKMGLNKKAVAGVMGNIYQESHGNPHIFSSAGGGLFGLTIANGGRPGGGSLSYELGKLRQYIATNGSVSDINRHAGTAAEAAQYFCTKYERAGIADMGNRVAAADNAFKLGYATGGHAPAGTVAMVGERGPELVKFNSDANVFTSKQSAQLMKAAVAEGPHHMGASSLLNYSPLHPAYSGGGKSNSGGNTVNLNFAAGSVVLGGNNAGGMQGTSLPTGTSMRTYARQFQQALAKLDLYETISSGANS